MDAITLLAVAVSLALDAFSVSIASGIQTKGFALKMATSFGAFQAFMPLIGWSAGTKLLDLISGFDHWIALTILCAIGCKMIYEALLRRTEKPIKEPLNIYTLLLLSIATSIDALAAGLSFAFIKISIFIAIIVVGAVTFTLAPRRPFRQQTGEECTKQI